MEILCDKNIVVVEKALFLLSGNRRAFRKVVFDGCACN
jgi:hypothetical protein